ncbi:AMP-binding protein [Usitatibacter palustris]|uniref:Surfactin synthase subunit 2 n=1 Tax=Usitatibacter palustris TaxID=2732487 RepID=A0A6M4H886_9PROT|nr:AMP-binding protein [Usitatibacter palustris]QJR15826.1 Surfactin synthase subunit 2 [Usitatibacter palustris]
MNTTLLELVRATVARTPEAPAALIEGQVVNYRHLNALVCVATRDFHARGIGPGEVVAVSTGQGLLAIIALLALANLGAVSVTMVPGLGTVRASLCRRYGARRVVLSDQAAAIDGVESLVLASLQAQGHETMHGLDDFSPRAETPVRIALASGSAGETKGVVQTHGDLERRLRNSFWDTRSSSRVLPPNLEDTASLMMCFSALRDGGLLVLPKSGSDLAAVLLAVQVHGVTHLVLSRASLVSTLALLPADGPAFPSLTHLRIAGGPPPTEILTGACKRITPNVYLTYATSELGVISLATPETLARAPRSSGRVASHACVEVVDESGRKVAPGGTGELRIAVEDMPQGYHAADDASGSRFRDGWFHPGDRGHIGADGLLYVERNR